MNPAKKEKLFSKTQEETKYVNYKYTLAKWLSGVESSLKDEIVEALAKSLNISTRMMQNYIYAKRRERAPTLSRERLLKISELTGIPVNDIITKVAKQPQATE